MLKTICSMIQQESRVRVTDNSGARVLQCIRVLGTSNPKYATIGDRIVGVVKESLPNVGIKKSEIVQAVIVRIRKPIRRKNGMWIQFDDNAAVILQRDGNPKGTRVFGPIARELREKNYTKILSLAPEVF